MGKKKKNNKKSAAKSGRNAPCPCGSGKKYKKCCLKKEELEKEESRREAESLRQMWKETESRREKRQRELEEYFEPLEQGPDEYDDGRDDEDPQEYEIVPKKEPHPVEIPKVTWELGEISEQDKALVEDWHARFWKLEDPDDMTAHLDSFAEQRPDLVDHLELQEEALFKIVRTFGEKKRHEEAVDLLEKIRSSYPETYKQNYGYYDFWIASYKLATGKKDEIPDFLNYFIEYPDHSPDYLFQLLHMLEAFDCLEILQDFVPRIYVPVCQSPDIYGGDEIIETLDAILFARHAKPDYTREDAEKLAAEFSALDVDINEKYCSPEGIETYLAQIFAPLAPWKIDDCRTREQLIDRYRNIARNFSGYLVSKKVSGWAAANYNTRKIFSYLVQVVPRNMRPKTPFVFSKKVIEETATALSKDLVFVRSINYFGVLNAVYLFADYLVDAESISPEFRDEIQQWCMELHAEAYPILAKNSFEAIAFERFPLVPA